MAGAPDKFQVFPVLHGAVEMGAGGEESGELVVGGTDYQTGFTAEAEEFAGIRGKFVDFSHHHIGNGGFDDFRRHKIAYDGVKDADGESQYSSAEEIIKEFFTADGTVGIHKRKPPLELSAEIFN